MNVPHQRRSRVAKALIDRPNGETDFKSAEQRLANIHVSVVLEGAAAKTAAGQAAALTAVSTSFKCFGSVTLVGPGKTKLLKELPIGKTIGSASSALGASVAQEIPSGTTHTILIGELRRKDETVFIRCWWDGWIAGVVPRWDERQLGAGGNPLAGVFSGALAVREVFATVLGYPRTGSRVSIASLWEPWLDPESAGAGPSQVYLPSRLWFVGLGHLGQGYLWNLGLLSVHGMQAVLQDDQQVGEENEATGLLTTANDINIRKTRVSARWLENTGWPTSLIERRHYGDIPLLRDDPAIVITGLDEPEARIDIANAGFDYMVDAGLGHGAVDFEGLQIRVLKKGVDAAAFWASPEARKDVDEVLEQEAYKTHAMRYDRCGTRQLAEASVAVPFVGAAAGALTIGQVIRLGSMQKTVQFMQVELGAPAMAMSGSLNDAPASSRGTVMLRVG